MLRLYNAMWYPALPFALALSGARGDAEARRARLGLACSANGAAPGAPRIWAHAASVGEVGALRAVLAALLDELPQASAVVTTMTAAGRDAARRSIPAARAHLLAPLDCRRALEPFLAAVRPTLVLIAETELWPNYFVESHAAGARIAIVNGRVSERALARYRYVRPLLAAALAYADLVLAQSEEDACRFRTLGAAADRIRVTGNTKLDLPSLTPPALRPALAAFAYGRPLVVAGSTAPGEDQIAVDAYLELRARFPTLALAIAPRHLERTSEVERIVARAGLSYVKASALKGADTINTPSALVLDTMGELRALYALAAVAFVGGSLVRGRGGQSPVEPAAAAVPVMLGPFHDNQRAIADALLKAQAAAVVRDAAEFARVAAAWLGDEAARRAAGDRARAAVERMGGGLCATLAHLRPLLGATT
ncbi:MAG TPA: glycosyltransferase N-terminal domain-containing protein [Candidatus Binataceae bacterium]|nr:glycosyltransferase N-terminal domain-containing protein [Candidatus Binataceae bacterium]